MIRNAESDINTPEHYEELYTGYRDLEMRPMPMFGNLVSMLFKNGKVLDIGCGPGGYFQYYNNCEIYGTEFCKNAYERAMALRPDAIINNECNLNDGLPFEDDFFDFSFCGQVLEHIEEPEKFIIECHRVLKKGGILVLGTPYKDSIPCAEHLWFFDNGDMVKMTSMFERRSITRCGLEEADAWEHFMVICRK